MVQPEDRNLLTGKWSRLASIPFAGSGDSATSSEAADTATLRSALIRWAIVSAERHRAVDVACLAAYQTRNGGVDNARRRRSECLGRVNCAQICAVATR